LFGAKYFESPIISQEEMTPGRARVGDGQVRSGKVRLSALMSKKRVGLKTVDLNHPTPTKTGLCK